jgi:putative ABC transport system ATP-binding protein
MTTAPRHRQAGPVLQLEAVSKVYPGDPPIPALREVDLAVREGELVGIVGPSGSGKSTLLHIAGTLDRPSAGRLHIGGRDVATLTDRQLSALRGAWIGFVFQRFFLAEQQSVLDNVADGLLYAGVRPTLRRRAAADAIERVGLGTRIRSTPDRLSGGERQRVAIARAVIGRPAIVLADEPTGNLDSSTGAEIIALLHELNSQGCTIVVITHNRELAAGLPRQVAMLDGRIAADSAAGLAWPPATASPGTSGGSAA